MMAAPEVALTELELGSLITAAGYLIDSSEPADFWGMNGREYAALARAQRKLIAVRRRLQVQEAARVARGAIGRVGEAHELAHGVMGGWGTCPSCGRSYHIRMDGRLTKHRKADSLDRCPGSGERPVQ
jgi:hypothetical protein